MATITRKYGMNRVYVIGDVDQLSELLRDFRASKDERGYWVPSYRTAALTAAVQAEPAYQAEKAAALAGWEAAKAEIPAAYKTRHGSMYGGVVTFGGESFAEPGIRSPRVPWEMMAKHVTRVRDLTGTSSINGRVQDSATLYRAVTDDGRPVYRIATSSGFGDDLRETYYLPPDLWEKMMTAEVEARNITPQNASEWLEQYRGCAGTELYEFAATFAVRQGEDKALPSPRK